MGIGRNRLLAAIAAAAIGVCAGTSKALASAGCDAVNAGTFTFSVVAGGSSTRPAQTFAAGDVLSFTITRVNEPGSDGANFSLLDSTTSDTLVSRGGTATNEAGSYTVTASALSIQAQLESLGSSISVTMTCTPVPTAATGPTDSDKLRGVQVPGSKIVAQTSGQAIAGAIDGAVGSALGSSGPGGATGSPLGGGPAGLGGAGIAALGGPHRAPEAAAASGPAAIAWQRNGWQAWGNLRLTASERRPTASMAISSTARWAWVAL